MFLLSIFFLAAPLTGIGVFAVACHFSSVMMQVKQKKLSPTLILLDRLRIAWAISLALVAVSVIGALIAYSDRVLSFLNRLPSHSWASVIFLCATVIILPVILGEMFSTCSIRRMVVRAILLAASPLFLIMLPFLILGLPLALIGGARRLSVPPASGYYYDRSPACSPYPDTARASAPRAGIDINYPAPGSAYSWENNPNNPANRGWNWNKNS